MNRQQRRQQARQREAYNRLMASAHEKQRQKQAGEIEIELYFTAFGLALNEVYGWKKDPTLKLWQATDEWISKLADGEITFQQMKAELERRSGVICSFH